MDAKQFRKYVLENIEDDAVARVILSYTGLQSDRVSEREWLLEERLLKLSTGDVQ